MYRGPRQRVGPGLAGRGARKLPLGSSSRAALITYLASNETNNRQRGALREAREGPPTEARVHAVLLAEGESDGHQADKPGECLHERRATKARQALPRGAGPRQPDKRPHEVPGCQPSRCLKTPFV